jgi:hypothetical protein
MFGALKEYCWLVRSVVLPEATCNTQHNVQRGFNILLSPDEGNNHLPKGWGLKIMAQKYQPKQRDFMLYLSTLLH